MTLYKIIYCNLISGKYVGKLCCESVSVFQGAHKWNCLPEFDRILIAQFIDKYLSSAIVSSVYAIIIIFPYLESKLLPHYLEFTIDRSKAVIPTE